MHHDQSIYNIKQITVFGNLHNHDCTYNSSQYLPIKIKFNSSNVKYVSVQNCHIKEDFVWYLSIKNNPIIWLRVSTYCRSRVNTNIHYYRCTNKDTKCPSTIILKTSDDDAIIESACVCVFLGYAIPLTKNVFKIVCFYVDVLLMLQHDCKLYQVCLHW